MENGPASGAGIRTGDVIVAVDGTTVDAENDLASLIGTCAGRGWRSHWWTGAAGTSSA
ncbi:MAG: PDZ domain-containing protein [Caldilineaceae bacterium]